MATLVRSALTVAVALVMVVLCGVPSHAATTSSFSVTDNPAGNDGAGKTWGTVTWVDSDRFQVERWTKDICPGDGKSVQSIMEIYVDRRLAADDTMLTNWKWVTAGCGTTVADSFKWGYSTADAIDYREVWRIRFGALVEGGNRTWGAWIDNPYSNDPSRTGA